jgi:hypothetical protein
MYIVSMYVLISESMGLSFHLFHELFHLFILIVIYIYIC